jgi:hypothetical protein
MLDSLLAAAHPLRQIVEFTVDGIHTERNDSRNQPWDNKVAEVVTRTCQQITLPSSGQFEWYAVHLRLTKNRFWLDDDLRRVRAIHNEAVIIENTLRERAEVTIYAAMAA